MLEEAYSYGLTPHEATELTVAEMASFITAHRKREKRLAKILAQIEYSAGIIASMSLSKTRPKFEEVFDFSDETSSSPEWVKSKNALLCWAETMNKKSRRKKNGR